MIAGSPFQASVAVQPRLAALDQVGIADAREELPASAACSSKSSWLRDGAAAPHAARGERGFRRSPCASLSMRQSSPARPPLDLDAAELLAAEGEALGDQVERRQIVRLRRGRAPRRRGRISAGMVKRVRRATSRPPPSLRYETSPATSSALMVADQPAASAPARSATSCSRLPKASSTPNLTSSALGVRVAAWPSPWVSPAEQRQPALEIERRSEP